MEIVKESYGYGIKNTTIPFAPRVDLSFYEKNQKIGSSIKNAILINLLPLIILLIDTICGLKT